MLKFLVPIQKRVMLFICITVLCFVLGSVIVGVLTYNGSMTTPKVRIAMILQDVMMWIVPAVVTAMMITRRPAEFLMVRRSIDLLMALLVCAVLLSSIPMMNVIISWNANIELPESMSAMSQWMHSAEESANHMVEVLIGGSTAGSLIMGILIVGLLAGFSEEIFFRGTVQRLFTTANVNHHIAIWVTAIIFTTVHFQFFGFVPRLLLGAYFGYVAYWSRNIWLAIIAHAFNNTLAVISFWVTPERMPIDLNSIGTDFSTPEKYLSAISLFVTSILLYVVYKLCRKHYVNQTSCD